MIMKIIMRLLRHVMIILLALIIFPGIPVWILTGGGIGLGFKNGADVITRASLELPEIPSGNFLILLNQDEHPGTVRDWTLFFEEKPVDVIMEDINCLIISGDAAGKELAERYQARLSENQMKWRQENGILAASRVENGLFDAVILSQEAADAYGIDCNIMDGRGENNNIKFIAIGEAS